MARYRAAIVGLGRIASTFAADKKRKGVSTHAQAYLADRRVELVAACDRDPERLRDFGARWGVDRLYADLGELLKREKPHFLSVCTWNATHEELVRQAVAGGVRGIVCEKPLADTLAAGERMIAACRKANVPLLVNYSRRYNAAHRKVAAWVRGGGLGAVQTVSSYYTAGVMNTGTHLFDLLRMCFGEVSWVWANRERVLPAADPSMDLVLQFQGGFACNVAALDVGAYMQFETDVYGTSGRLRFEDSGMLIRRWKVAPHKVYGGYRTLEPAADTRVDLSRNLPGLVDNLIRSVEGKEMPFCSGEDGLAALEIAMAAHLSLKKGAPVKLPIKERNLKLESK